MPKHATGFLATRRDDGFGDVLPLDPAVRYTIGRAPDCTIVVKDDLVSRKHAEVFHDGRQWVVRDHKSLNGTRLNGDKFRGDAGLRGEDELTIGQTVWLYVDSLDELPGVPATLPGHHPTGGLEITRRLGHTKYIPSAAGAGDAGLAPPPTEKLPARGGSSEAVAALYQLAIGMSDANTEFDLAQMVVETLLQSTPAEVGAVLSLRDSGDAEPLVYRTKIPTSPTYHKVSDFVGREVLANRQAVLAEDVRADDDLANRESLTEMRVASLICAPILVDGKATGLLHLYSSSDTARLNADDLEFTIAVAHHLGVVWQKLRRQSGLSAENRALRDQLRLDSELVYRGPAMRTVEAQVARVAATRATVLIRGESGVGKELVARAIHFNSPRKDQPAGLPELRRPDRDAPGE